MGKAQKPRRVKLIIGMLAKDKRLFDIAEGFFTKKFGPIDYRSPLIPFNQTDYYKKEMGYPLERKFVSFKKLISPEGITEIKLLTNSIEKRLSVKNGRLLKRAINIDPGYISDAKLILATTKDFSHRIYMGRGIYAEVTLFWKKKGFESFNWTYPDYKTPEYIDVLSNIRNAYVDTRDES